MSGTSITIDWKTSKSGNKSFYVTVGDDEKCPVEMLDTDEQGRLLLFVPCAYYPKSLYDDMGSRADGILGIVERLADYGKIRVIDDKEIPKLYGEQRLMEWNHRYYNVVDGSLVLIWDKKNSEAHWEVCVKE